MAGFRVQAVTPWTVINNSNVGQITVEYPSEQGWTDITGQVPEAMIPEPPLFVMEGIITNQQFADLSTDQDYEVLFAEPHKEFWEL